YMCACVRLIICLHGNKPKGTKCTRTISHLCTFSSPSRQSLLSVFFLFTERFCVWHIAYKSILPLPAQHTIIKMQIVPYCISKQPSHEEKTSSMLLKYFSLLK
ncbi:hypothetical protein H1C71_042028, partial [Ictidomys tridecemlineatus]